MIQGLHFDVSSEELKAHLAARIDHHNERVAFYRENVNNLEAGSAEAQKFTGGDPIRALRESLEQHTEKVALYTWLHDHVIEGETYRLGEKDLNQIGIVKGYGGW